MAINKSINTDYGVDATYWNIGAYEEDFKGGGAVITIYGYASEDARRNGKQPLAAAKFQIPDYTPDDNRESLYLKIKNLPQWAGSTDK